MHHRSAVWSAVMAGVPLVRSAGHGISAVYATHAGSTAEVARAVGEEIAKSDLQVDVLPLCRLGV